MDDDTKKWKRLYNGLAKRVVDLEKANDILKSKLLAAVLNLQNAQRAVDNNKQLIRQSLTDWNTKEQDYIGIINLLRSKLKELGFGDFDRLGK